jgi:hypothetical protein
MIDRDKVESAISAISDAINAGLQGLDGADRGTVIANVTIAMFRVCEEELTEESMEQMMDIIEDDDGDQEVLH